MRCRLPCPSPCRQRLQLYYCSNPIKSTGELNILESKRLRGAFRGCREGVLKTEQLREPSRSGCAIAPKIEAIAKESRRRVTARATRKLLRELSHKHNLLSYRKRHVQEAVMYEEIQKALYVLVTAATPKLQQPMKLLFGACLVEWLRDSAECAIGCERQSIPHFCPRGSKIQQW